MMRQPTLEHPYSKYATISKTTKLIACHSAMSMQRLTSSMLSSIITAALMISILSARNTYTLNASRSLHAFTLEGPTSKVFHRLNKSTHSRDLGELRSFERGVPYIAVIMVVLLSCLEYLALGSSRSQVLNWISRYVHSALRSFLLLTESLASVLLLGFCMYVLQNKSLSFHLIILHHMDSLQRGHEDAGIEKKSFLANVSRFQQFAGYWAFVCAFSSFGESSSAIEPPLGCPF